MIMIFSLMLVLVAWKTATDLRPFPESLSPESLQIVQPRVLDRHNIPLSVTYRNPWNIHDWVPLHRIPPLLQQAFILSEDKRFHSHNGVDWSARIHALIQNVESGRVVRGASTITEQVTRMLHPRSRTFWSRWIEGFEAHSLEKRFSKTEILEFYLNQVPYARQRRGVAQAARLYFDRDLGLLYHREAIALVILVRSPSRMDLFQNTSVLDHTIEVLIQRMFDQGMVSDRELELARTSPLMLQRGHVACEAAQYVRQVLGAPPPTEQVQAAHHTTLDAVLQEKLQGILDSGLLTLQERDATNGALLVVDHRNGEILAWVNGGGGATDPKPGTWIDAVTLPRQPGSTLKPFLYALALEKGWTAATLLDDYPLSERLRSGLHTFRNYSRTHYGPLRLREALGNSLNIPAVRTVQFTGTQAFLNRLRLLGFENLSRSSDFYGHGLALGDGEVSLFELVQAYGCLARSGRFLPLHWSVSPGSEPLNPRQIIPEEVASLVAHILSDPQARRIEFGEGHLLSLPIQTAVKTGTSSDHRDTWAVGFSHRHVVGVWMGNLDRRPTRGLTGTTGPGLILRAVFAELNRTGTPGWLPMSSRLERKPICQKSGLLPGAQCPTMEEFFVPGSAPASVCPMRHALWGEATPSRAAQAPAVGTIEMVQPVAGLNLAMDPRVPDDLESFTLLLPQRLPSRKVHWIIDGAHAGTTGAGSNRLDWPMKKGSHTVHARIWLTGTTEAVETRPVTFTVR